MEMIEYVSLYQVTVCHPKAWERLSNSVKSFESSHRGFSLFIFKKPLGLFVLFKQACYYVRSYINNEFNMKYEVIKQEVEQCFSKVDQLNRRAGFKRFFPFSTVRNGRLFEYGCYDYSRKKYVHFYAQTQDGESDVAELKSFISL